MKRLSFVAHGLLAVTLGIAATSSASAWSSLEYCPMLFEPVHQLAIEKVLKDKITPADLTILQEQQVLVDKAQQAPESYQHSMTGLLENQTLAGEKSNYIKLTEKFIHDNLTDAIAARKAGNEAKAFASLGQALHPLQDATSPAHEGFQPWSYNESIWAKAQHVSLERVYPDDPSDQNQVKYRRRLEGVIRWAYAIFTETTALPPSFFDGDGNLLLPATYTPPETKP